MFSVVLNVKIIMGIAINSFCKTRNLNSIIDKHILTFYPYLYLNSWNKLSRRKYEKRMNIRKQLN